MDFIFETRSHLLTEHPAWYSREEYKCGLSQLELSVSFEDNSPVTDEVKNSFAEFFKHIESISQKVSEEVQERFEKFKKMGVNPHDKLMKQMEESLSFMSKTMLGASAKDKEDSMAKIRENMLGAIPPKEEGNDNLTEEEFHLKTKVTASIAPFESSNLIYLYVTTPHCYTGEDIILMNWSDGRFLSFEECQQIADDEFISQDGIEYQGLKFVNGGESVSDEQITVFEEELGWKLPDSYKAFLKTVNGGTPAIAGDRRIPTFDRLKDDKNESMTLRWRNFETDLNEYLKAGFFTFADAGHGCGGHSSIYLQPGKHYGKVFCWYWDDCLCPDQPMDGEINTLFFKENLIAKDFSAFIELLRDQSEENYDEDKVDVLDWLSESKERTLGVMSSKESRKFVEKLLKKGCLEVYTEEYLDEEDDNIDDLEIILKDSKDVRLDLESWLDKKNWQVNQYEKNHWNISSNDFDDYFMLWDNIESLLMLKFDFIELDEMEDWKLIRDVVESMNKASNKDLNTIEKEVLEIFKEALQKDVALDTDITAYVDY